MAVRSKVICIKRFAWQRVAREFSRLGWDIVNAEQETSTTYTHHYDVYEDGTTIHTGTDKSSKVRIWLSMVRDRDWYVNGNKIIAIDIFFSIFFLLRRVMGALTPIAAIPFVILLLIGFGTTEVGQVFMALFFSFLGSWILLQILEFVFSVIGGNILAKGERGY